MALFARHGVYTRTEIQSRQDINMEEYAKIIHIEALTLIDMLGKLIVPACVAYSRQLAEGVAAKAGIGVDAPAEAAQVRLLTEKTAELIERGELAAPDVVYLDPMFPERTKSAAVKKKFQLLHHLEQPCADEETLVEAALAVHPRKVVIKRPVKGALLAGVKPSYQLAGKAVRYDVLVPPRP